MPWFPKETLPMVFPSSHYILYISTAIFFLYSSMGFSNFLIEQLPAPFMFWVESQLSDIVSFLCQFSMHPPYDLRIEKHSNLWVASAWLLWDHKPRSHTMNMSSHLQDFLPSMVFLKQYRVSLPFKNCPVLSS
jgi:hypothetical protein